MFSIVTAFLDIGRENWNDKYARSLNDYLVYFENVLSIKAPIIVFTEEKFIDFVKTRRPDANIIPIDIKTLQMYSNLNRIERIQEDPQYAIDHPNPQAPEISKPLYNIVTCSKMEFMLSASRLFGEYKYFIWMDAGYTHNTVKLSEIDWYPSSIITEKNKLSVIALRSLDDASINPRIFFNQYIDVIIGGFFGGTKQTIITIFELYYDLIEECLRKGIKDDDQFYMTILAKRRPDLFNVIQGDWFDGIKIK